ncbi:hypothetical protein AtDm6_0692 [Acetobacter tropicalis]|uniref:Uncharacterized protein n=1 Tax=Acetobacter tropicalis TaxID=104102 RepID=A0A094YVN6_9PROT|nr:hypothetical protein AtDm6_0692 [Acetobacter tropicalis]
MLPEKRDETTPFQLRTLNFSLHTRLSLSRNSRTRARMNFL